MHEISNTVVAAIYIHIFKGFASLGILVAWSIWRHRNSVVFDSARPFIDLVIQSILDETRTWALAGVKGLAAITQFEPP